MRLHLSFQVLLITYLSSCFSTPINETTTNSPKSPTTNLNSTTITTQITTTSKPKDALNHTQTNKQKIEVRTEKISSQNYSDSVGVEHIINHSTLFTEFLSFAINPVKTADAVLDKIKNNPNLDQTSISQEYNMTVPEVKATSLGANSTDSNSTTPLETTSYMSNDLGSSSTQSHEGLQQLFVELMKRNSPGFIVSFDYLEIKKKSLGVEENIRHPIRAWGIVPDENTSKTIYFLADPYRIQSTETEMKETPQEQIDDFECWKNETLIRLEGDEDDKLGDGTIGSLLGIG